MAGEMNLTAHFTEEELTKSSRASQLGIDNTPTNEIRENLYTLADGLERIRSLLGCAMFIDSGYRCPKLNTAIKGAKNSAHMLGLAADFVAPNCGTPLEVTRLIVAHKESIGFNKIIMEGRWVHVDFPKEGDKPSLTILTAHFGPGGTTYTNGV